MEFRFSAETLQSIIFTLKSIDVRGYDSMDRLVGLVMLFERVLNTPVAKPEKITADVQPEDAEV